jgi:hypothetical protein
LSFRVEALSLVTLVVLLVRILVSLVRIAVLLVRILVEGYLGLGVRAVEDSIELGFLPVRTLYGYRKRTKSLSPLKSRLSRRTT